jgi:NAD+ diphosphatase
MPFKPAFKPSDVPGLPEIWFLFQDEKVVTKQVGPRHRIVSGSDVRALDLIPVRAQYMGSLNGRSCFAAELENKKNLPAGLKLSPLRALIGKLDEDIFWLAGRANHLVHWNRNHAFCGKCGHPTKNKEDERAKMCPKCGLINYPRVSPAVIVAVYKDNDILLAHSARFPTNYYSVLAGFVEPGESLEACVRREVMEEVNLRVKNIRYFACQPWPFPDSLMIGFTAQYAGGSIRVDRKEILHAAWFTPHNLPPVPPEISIARQLINHFVSNHP